MLLKQEQKPKPNNPRKGTTHYDYATGIRSVFMGGLFGWCEMEEDS